MNCRICLVFCDLRATARKLASLFCQLTEDSLKFYLRIQSYDSLQEGGVAGRPVEDGRGHSLLISLVAKPFVY